MKYVLLSNVGPKHNLVFTYAVLINGSRYFGSGSSKKTAKLSAAEAVFDVVFPPHCRKLENSNEDDLQDKRVDKNAYALMDGNPIGVLLHLRPELCFYCIGKIGPPHAVNYKFGLDIDGKQFAGEGFSKKDAKRNCAKLVLSSMLSLISGEMNLNTTVSDIDFNMMAGYNVDFVNNNVDSKNCLKEEWKDCDELLFEARNNRNLKYYDLGKVKMQEYNLYMVSVRIDENLYFGKGKSKELAMENALALIKDNEVNLNLNEMFGDVFDNVKNSFKNFHESVNTDKGEGNHTIWCFVVYAI